MSYTAAQLTTFFTNVHVGRAPTAAEQLVLNAWASQNASGTLSDAMALQNVINTADGETAVAIATYQYFTGLTPTAGGLTYLVNSPANTTDLNDPYYANFGLENRYINFASNLALGGPSAAAFASTYGSLSITQVIEVAYETIIGTAQAQAAGYNAAAAKADIGGAARMAYFNSLVAQNFPTATAAQKDLALKAEIIGYIMAEAIKADVGAYAASINNLLADLAVDNIATLNTDLTATYGSATTATPLGAGVDTITANVFNAARVFNPGGTDQVNSLNDDDVLTGVGTDPTLNFTFVNDSDTNDYDITPTLRNVQVVNVTFATDGSGAGAATLDLQDATGLDDSVNVFRVDDDLVTAAVRNLGNDGITPDTLSVNNTNAPASTVLFTYTDTALAGAADSVKVSANNIEVASLVVQTNAATAGIGLETINLNSIGGANKIGVLTAEDLENLTVTGSKNLTLGTTSTTTNAGLVEATRFGAGLANVAGSLNAIDASAFTANLDITLGSEMNAGKDGTSGVASDVVVKGGAGNDVFRLANANIDAKVGAGTGDSIDGGAGTNSLVILGSSTINNTVSKVQALEIRTGHDAGVVADTVAVDASKVTDLATTLIRNEGQDFVGGVWVSASEVSTVNLTKMSAAQLQALTVLHGTTGNSNILNNVINATLTTATGTADTAAITIMDGTNADPRFNLQFSSAGTENVKLTDSDTESNSVRLVTAHTGTLTLLGGQTGLYMNLDTLPVAGTTGGAFQKDMSGGILDGTLRADLSNATTTTGVLDIGNVAADRFGGVAVDAATYASDIILRVGTNAASTDGAQTITLGTGNDTVIFDVVALADVTSGTAGLTNADIVKGGLGSDTLAIDGHGKNIIVQQSEWDNVSQFETLRLMGNGGFKYFLQLDNDLIDNNGGDLLAIVNDDQSAVSAVTNVDAAANNSAAVIFLNQLSANNHISYDGEEGGGSTIDRFVVNDANTNGGNIIDGGEVDLRNTGWVGGLAGQRSNDILEVRNTATVTTSDLTNVKNVGVLVMNNDQAVTQTLNLTLNDATVDLLVDAGHASSATEVEQVRIVANDGLMTDEAGNAIVAVAGSALNVEARGLTAKSSLSIIGDTGFAINDTVNISTNVGSATPHFIDLAAGAGDTVNWYGNFGSAVIVMGVAGTAAFTTGATTTTHDMRNVEVVNLFNAASTTGATVTGTAATDTITGTEQADTINGAGGADTINGGGGNDLITGGTGRDVMNGGAGNDSFIFAAGVADTVGAAASIAGVDLIQDLNLGTILPAGAIDSIDLTVAVANVGTTNTGSVTEATFIANMNTLLTAATFGFVTTAGGIDAAIITANAGDLSGRSFLAVDLNASDTFTATDFVVEITGYTGVINVADFI